MSSASVSTKNKSVRIAFVNCSSRKIGGVESYLEAVLPIFAARGHALGFWAETDVPDHRPRILLPAMTEFWSADNDQLGVSAAVLALAAWRPDVLFVHKVDAERTERRLLDVAPAVVFSHDYHATCISGTKSFSFPLPRPCDRRFGLGCLVCYYPRRCGGLSPVTMFKLYHRQSERLKLLNHYRGVLVASDHMAREYRRHGVNAEVIIHTHKSPELSHVSPTKEAPNGLVRLAFLGRLEKLKGVALLLRALPMIAEQLKWQVQCEIAGQGTDERRLQSMARRVAKRSPSVAIRFHGWLSSAQCQQLLAQSHLMVMPSVWPEPFGGVGFLAGSLNVPAVTFDLGGVRQWLRDDLNGVLAPGDPPTASGLARAIVRAVRDPAHYQRLCLGAYQLSKTASLEAHVEGVEEHLERALG